MLRRLLLLLGLAVAAGCSGPPHVADEYGRGLLQEDAASDEKLIVEFSGGPSPDKLEVKERVEIDLATGQRRELPLVEPIADTADIERASDGTPADEIEPIAQMGPDGKLYVLSEKVPAFESTAAMGEAYPHLIIDGLKFDYDPAIKWYRYAGTDVKAYWIEIESGSPDGKTHIHRDLQASTRHTAKGTVEMYLARSKQWAELKGSPFPDVKDKKPTAIFDLKNRKWMKVEADGTEREWDESKDGKAPAAIDILPPPGVDRAIPTNLEPADPKLFFTGATDGTGTMMLYGRADTTYEVEKRFLVPMKATAIERAAEAIAAKDKKALNEMVDAKELGGLAAGTRFRLLSRGENGIAWFAEAYPLNAPKPPKVYIYDAYLDPSRGMAKPVK